MLNTNFSFLDYFNEYGFSIIFINIIVYLLLLMIIFGIFFFFDLRYFRTLNELKGLNNYVFLLSVSIIIFLSLAGMPPLLGFIGKFLLFIYLSFKNQYLLFFIFTCINLFTIYFYVQNTRFLIKNSTSNLLNIRLNYVNLDFRIIFFIIFINFFNLSGLFFFNDFLIDISFWTSFIYLG